MRVLIENSTDPARRTSLAAAGDLIARDPTWHGWGLLWGGVRMFEIAPGLPEDLAGVEAVSQQAFADYGDYAGLVGKFYATQGVHSFVAREGQRLVGFVLLGFMPWTGGEPDDERDWWIGEVLAIAVAEGQRGRGAGRALMERALALVAEMGEWRDLKEIQLTCAAGNQPALDFFARYGFQVADRNQGTYSSGQAAWRLARPLA